MSVYDDALAACNTRLEPKEHLGEINTIVLDSIMERDEALSSNMKFIAINMNNFEEVEEYNV
ncbi:hypothetical protein ACFTQ7_07870 [Lysinibacillus sp. NPDC056959]|uniref:hypothetical protein n=1 Tax=Lysinibacillus sp. NPDC056959 TaxID=3345981 RepID=UPI0036357182